MSPRRKTRLKLYSFAFLFSFLAIYSLYKLWNGDDWSSEEERHALFAPPGDKLSSKHVPLSLKTDGHFKNIKQGIQAPAIKKLDMFEKAPRGKIDYFKENLILIQESDKGGASRVRKSSTILTGLKLVGKDEVGENAKFRNLSSNLSARKEQKPSKTFATTGGMLPLIDQSKLDIRLYDNKEPLIPHIIHQTWDTYDVPQTFIPWIQSVIEKNPTWTYLFWTQDDVQCYFRERHPDFLDLYNSYWATIFKTDVMRYFLLYDIGGFYLDLDVECLKPLDIWSHYGHCLLSHETYEHVFLIQDRKLVSPNVMTTILACRPKHPYYKMLQDNLAHYKDAYKKDVLRATGPYFMQELLEKYLSLNASISKVDRQVDVLNPVYWLPTFDPVLRNKIEFTCNNKFTKLKPFAKEMCRVQMTGKYKNEPTDMSYLNHHWVHTNLKPLSFKKTNLVDIRSVIPNLIKISDYLKLKC